MHTANLCGPEQTQIGNHAAVGRGFAAIGLSRGGAAKTYRYRDPNEDACGFASSPAGMLLAVADGHWGYEGSQAAIGRLIESHAASLLASGDGEPPQPWEATARTLLIDLQQQILRAGGHRGAQPPRTTLSLAVAFPEQQLVNWLCVGDSLLFAVEERGAHEIGAPAGAIHYMGSPADDAERLSAHARVGSRSLRDCRALVLATDGLSEPGIGVVDPAASVASATASAARSQDPELRALETVRNLLEEVLSGQRRQRAGDNIAIAVGWLGAR